MKKKELTAKMVNAVLSGANFMVDGLFDFANSSTRIVDNMVVNFSGVSMNSEISGPVISCGQKAFDKSIQLAQKIVKELGK